MDQKTLQKSMRCLKTANKFRTETEFDESARVGDNLDNVVEKEDEMNSEDAKSESDSDESGQNDYESKRLQNIAEAKKKFIDNLKALKQGLKRKSEVSRPLLNCIYCNRTFKIPKYLEAHKRFVHNINLPKIEIKSEVYFECNVQTGLRQGSLGIGKICLEKFKTYDMIKEHIAQNHNFTCSACNESFKTKYKEKIHNCRPFECGCGTKFKNEQDLNAHVCYKCPYCDKLFPYSWAEKSHRGRHFNKKTGDFEFELFGQDPLNIWTRGLCILEQFDYLRKLKFCQF